MNYFPIARRDSTTELQALRDSASKKGKEKGRQKETRRKKEERERKERERLRFFTGMKTFFPARWNTKKKMPKSMIEWIGDRKRFRYNDRKQADGFVGVQSRKDERPLLFSSGVHPLELFPSTYYDFLKISYKEREKNIEKEYNKQIYIYM